MKRLDLTRRAALVAPSLLLVADAAVGVVVLDSRLPESLAYAKRLTGWREIDIANADADRWRALRARVSGPEIVGLTRWSDWTIVRGALETQGRRVRREARLSRALFLWSMS